jgi:RNA polymerase sigma-70 factor (ECF subfamily)
VASLINIAVRKTKNMETAKDCVQEVFISLYYQKEKLETFSSLKYYLQTALQNKIFNQYNKELTRRKHETESGKLDDFLASEFSLHIETKELEQKIEHHIKMLPPQCQKVFLLSRYENLSYKEIAQKLNISENTVDKHIQKALKQLRNSVVLFISIFLMLIK